MIFSAVDGFSSTIDFITIEIATWGSLIVILLWSVLYLGLYPSFRWKNREGVFLKIKKLGIFAYLTLAALLISFWLPFGCKSMMIQKEMNQNSMSFTPAFQKIDSSSFNVLIVRFEDYITEKKTFCIGRAIEESINLVKEDEELPLTLKPIYIDSIASPRNKQEAIYLQNKHNADLIIYGKAKNIQDGCSGADVCFRYNINNGIVANSPSAIEVNGGSYSNNYYWRSPEEIEAGLFQFDELSLKRFIKSLVNLKSNNPEEAFIELDAILNEIDSLDREEKNARLMSIANTYASYKEWERVINVSNKAIKDVGSVGGFYFRGLSFLSLGEYEKASNNFSVVLNNHSESAIIYQLRGLATALEEKHYCAIEDFNKALELDSTLIVSRINLGNLYVIFNEYEKALEQYKSVLSSKSDSFDANFGYAVVRSNTNEVREAIKYFSICAKQKPNYAKTFLNRGKCYHSIANYKRAKRDFSKAIELNPDYAEAYVSRGSLFKELGDFCLALDDYTSALGSDSNYVNAYHLIGDLYMDWSDLDFAFDYYTKAIEMNPNIDYSYQNRGVVAMKLNKDSVAKSDFERAMKLNVRSTLPYENRAVFYSRKKRNFLALKDLNTAIDIDPTNPDIFTKRGTVLLNLKDHECSLENYQKALELGAKTSSRNLHVAIGYYNFDKYELALPYINEAVTLKPNSCEVNFFQGLIQNALKDYKAANISFTNTLKYCPEDDQALALRALNYKSKLSKYSLAIKDYRRLQSLKPNEIYPLFFQGYCYMKINNLVKARKFIHQAELKDPDNYWVYLMWSAYYSQKENKAIAIRNLQKAVTLGCTKVDWLNDEDLLKHIKDSDEYKSILQEIELCALATVE